jgi:hypothetical protein
MELIEIPRLDKNSASPYDSLHLKTGKAGFDVLQMIVHGQIRE